jgi:hypothetical protein
MSIKRIFSSKAQVEISTMQIIGMVIAVVIILVTLAFFTGLMNIFFGPPDSGSSATLEKVYAAVQALNDPNNRNTSCFIKAEYLQSGWGMVGFNSDGVTTADDDFVCKMNEKCIEEHCGTTDQDIEKPSSCGTGPCLCLCNGGGATGIGDIDGSDCKGNGAICKKFARTVGFDTFYIADEADKCKQKKCDLVAEGKKCNGDKRNVQYSFVIEKTSAVKSGDGAVQFSIVETAKLKDYFSHVTTDCNIMVMALKQPKALPQAATPSQPSGTKVTDELAQQGAAGTKPAITVNQ